MYSKWDSYGFHFARKFVTKKYRPGLLVWDSEKKLTGLLKKGTPPLDGTPRNRYTTPMKFSLKISDLDGMTVGRLRELLEGMADENTFVLDRAYDISGDILDDHTELVIEDPVADTSEEDKEFSEECDRLFHQTHGDD